MSKWIVTLVRKAPELELYFFTGTSLTGKLEDAERFDSYADAGGASWNGPLWEASDKLDAQGFRSVIVRTEEQTQELAERYLCGTLEFEL